MSKLKVRGANRKQTNKSQDLDEDTQDISKLPPTIWDKYHQGRDNGNGDDYRNELINTYSYLIGSVAKRLYGRLPNKFELEDLTSIGVFGLMDAIDSFDPSKGIEFKSYGYSRIKGSMLDEIREMDWIPRLVRMRTAYVEKEKTNFKAEKGHDPSDKELVNYLAKNLMDRGNKSDSFVKKTDKSTSLKERRSYARRILRDSYPPIINSLDDCPDQKGVDEKTQQKKYFFENKESPDPLIETQKQDLKKFLLTKLNRTERLIVVLYYYEEMTQKEIGKVLGFTEGRVSQMRSSLMLKLNSGLTKKSKTHQGRLELIF